MPVSNPSSLDGVMVGLTSDYIHAPVSSETAAIPFNNSYYDPAGHFDTTTDNRLEGAGVWHVTCDISIKPDTTREVQVYPFKNGSNYPTSSHGRSSYHYSTANKYNNVSLNVVVELAAGDYFDVRVYTPAGSSTHIDSYFTRLTAVRIG